MRFHCSLSALETSDDLVVRAPFPQRVVGSLRAKTQFCDLSATRILSRLRAAESSGGGVFQEKSGAKPVRKLPLIPSVSGARRSPCWLASSGSDLQQASTLSGVCTKHNSRRHFSCIPAFTVLLFVTVCLSLAGVELDDRAPLYH